MILPEWPWWYAWLALAVVTYIILRRWTHVLGMVVAAAIIFNFIQSTLYPFDRILTGLWFVMAALVALLAFLIAALSTDWPLWVRRLGNGAAAIALTIAVVVSFWGAPLMAWNWLTTSSGALTNLQQQLDDSDKRVDEELKKLAVSQAAGDAKDVEQDSRLKAIEEELPKIKGRLDSLEGRVSHNEVDINGLASVRTPADTSSADIANKVQADLTSVGWKDGQISVGTVDWNRNAFDQGRNAFVKNRLDSQEKLRVFINGDSEQSRATRQYLLEHTPESEHERLLSGVGFIPVQFNEEVCLAGNTYFDPASKKAVSDKDKVACHPAGDIMWLYVGSDATPYWDAAVRADCGNAGNKAVPRPASSKPRVAAVCESGDYKGRTPVNGSCDKSATTDATQPTTEPTTEPTAEPTPTPSEEPTPAPTPTTTTPEPFPVCRKVDGRWVVVTVTERKTGDVNPDQKGNCPKVNSDHTTVNLGGHAPSAAPEPAVATPTPGSTYAPAPAPTATTTPRSTAPSPAPSNVPSVVPRPSASPTGGEWGD